MMEQFDLTRLNDLVAQGYLALQYDSQRNLYLVNYTPRCQYEKHWTPETLACRGVVLDGEGNVVSRCLPKFFNLAEHAGDIPAGEPEIYEKMDGSLILVSRYDESHSGPALVTSRGSFKSDQSNWAREILAERYGTDWIQEGWTYVFELIHPANRIVVNYGAQRDLVLLAKIETKTGREENILFCGEWEGPRATRMVPFDPISLAELAAMERPNFEGWVLFWREAGLRLKVKLAEYVRLHKAMTGLTERDIWECLRLGESVSELITGVPDEVYDWVTRVHDDLLLDFQRIQLRARQDYLKAPKDSRKEFADFAQGCEYPGILFRMYDSRTYHDIIWKLVRPATNRAFWNDKEAA